VAIGIMDFDFIVASMGSAVGEKCARLIDLAIERRYPLILVSASGGARMHESILSLMQMAKVSARLFRLSEAGLPYISVMTDPTYAGVTASFAMLGDINIAEPDARIGFAGPRLVKETLMRDELPEGFQRAASLLEHGFIDRIVPRSELKQTLTYFIEMLIPN
jgi:acetyl-CoA carboxylase carboxyl transferase subunit beta